MHPIDPSDPAAPAILPGGGVATRVERPDLTRGRGRFTDDLPVKGALWVAFARAPMTAGRITALDVSAAAAMPKVVAVLTGDDPLVRAAGQPRPRQSLRRPDGRPLWVPPRPLLACERIHHLGEPVAAVVASDPGAARDAVEHIVLDVDAVPAVVDVVDAVGPDAPLVWPESGSNVAFLHEVGDAQGVARALAGAAKVSRLQLRISRVSANPLEPRAAVAVYRPASDDFVLWTGTQTPHRVRDGLAREVLGIDPARLRLVTPEVGGSFGMKNAAYPELAILLLLARQTQRPVRWTADRSESLLADYHGRDQWVEARLGLDAEGRFLALEVDVLANLGAYMAEMNAHSAIANLGSLAGVYRTPAIVARVRGVHTHTQLTAPYRGAGRPEAIHILERLIDAAAFDTGADRVELRRRNLVPATAMPYATGFVYTYDSGDFARVLERALAEADWPGFEARARASAEHGRWRGIGLALPIEIAGGPAPTPAPEFASLTVDADGSVTLALGVQDTGQGHAPTLKAVVAEQLGIEPARVAVVMGDTGRIEAGTGSFGSRTLGAAGAAIVAAADEVIRQAMDAAADALEVDAGDLVREGDGFRVRGTDRVIALEALAGLGGAPLRGTATVATTAPTFPNGCHIAEVEVDPETGAVQLLRYTVVDDVGRVLDPSGVAAQLHGGVAQGLGQALLEEVRHEPGSGQLLTGSFVDYAMPRARDLAQIGVVTEGTPTTANPLGVKGVGEAGTVGALPAVSNAVIHALRHAGVRHVDMPLTPARIWAAINAARAS